MLTRVIQLDNPVMLPLARKAGAHRARDAVDLADPLLYAVARAKRGTIKTLATPEQNLAQTVLRMRLIDASKR